MFKHGTYSRRMERRRAASFPLLHGSFARRLFRKDHGGKTAERKDRGHSRRGRRRKHQAFRQGAIFQLSFERRILAQAKSRRLREQPLRANHRSRHRSQKSRSHQGNSHAPGRNGRLQRHVGDNRKKGLRGHALRPRSLCGQRTSPCRRSAPGWPMRKRQFANRRASRQDPDSPRRKFQGLWRRFRQPALRQCGLPAARKALRGNDASAPCDSRNSGGFIRQFKRRRKNERTL